MKIIEINVDEYKDLHPEGTQRQSYIDAMKFMKIEKDGEVIGLRRYRVNEITKTVTSFHSFVFPEHRKVAKRFIETWIKSFIDKGYIVVLWRAIERIRELLFIKPKFNFVDQDGDLVVLSNLGDK